MAISSDYPRPITVNGFLCRNCDDVSEAKKFIDPSKPAAGTAAADTTDKTAAAFASTSDAKAGDNDPQRAVKFGGRLAFLNTASPISPPPAPASGTGQRYDKVA